MNMETLAKANELRTKIDASVKLQEMLSKPGTRIQVWFEDDVHPTVIPKDLQEIAKRAIISELIRTQVPLSEEFLNL